MVFACLGWGSLIWDKERAAELPIRGAWNLDGPCLPIEFARKSIDGRVTLVITPGAKRVPVLWAELDVSSIDEAIAHLAKREGPKGGRPTSKKYIGRSPGGGTYAEFAEIAKWQAVKGIDGVVWTALQPTFTGQAGELAQLDAILKQLESLCGQSALKAERYIWRTPPQIETGFRSEIVKWLDQRAAHI